MPGFGVWNVGKRPFEIVVFLASDPALPCQDLARLCPGAGDLGRQPRHRLFRLRPRLGGRRLLPEQRLGSRPCPQHRPRADLLPLGRQILRGDRQGRRRQGGAGGRSQPEGRHRQVAERHQEAGAASRGSSTLAIEFRNFAATFADIVKVKRESALLVQNQLSRDANMLQLQARRHRSSNAAESEPQAIEFGAKQVTAPVPGRKRRARQHLCHQFRPGGRHQRAGAAEIRRELARARSIATDDKIVAGLKEAKGLLVGLSRRRWPKLVENAKTVEDLVTEMSGSAGAISQGAGAMKADLVAEQQRLEARIERDHRRDRAADHHARRRRHAARRHPGAAARPRHLAADDRDVQGDARARRRQFRRRAARPRPQGRDRRDGRRGRGVQAAGRRQGRARCGRPGCAEQGSGRGAPGRADPLCRRFRDRRRRDRLQRLGLRGAAGAGRRHADAHGGNHAGPVEPGRRRLRGGLQQHRSRSRPRPKNCRRRSTRSASRSANPTGSRKPPSAQAQADRRAASANSRAPRRRSATSSS